MLCQLVDAAPDALSETEQIQVAVLRHELSLFKPGNYPPPKAFCVGVHAHVGDPSPEFLRALAGSYISLLSLSECKRTCPDEGTPGQGRVLATCGLVTTGDVWFEPAGQANVSVNFIAGPLWGRNGVYSLRKIDGAWMVQSYKLGTIS